MSDKTMLRHCPRCNISIVDDTIECPVCHGVVDDMEDRDMDSPSYSVTYPDVSQNTTALSSNTRFSSYDFIHAPAF